MTSVTQAVSRDEAITIQRVKYVAEAPCLPNPGTAHQADLKALVALIERRLASTAPSKSK